MIQEYEFVVIITCPDVYTAISLRKPVMKNRYIQTFASNRSEPKLFFLLVMLFAGPVLDITDLPTVAFTKHVLWLPIENQGRANFLSLSSELEYFAEYVKMDDMEVVARRSALIDLRDSLQAFLPSARLNQYGSFPAGLSTFMSDVDVSVDNVFDTCDKYDLHANISHPVNPTNCLKRPASLAEDTNRSMKRGRTGESSAVLTDVMELRQRVVEKLASKRISPDTVEGEEDLLVSWAIETSITTTELHPQDSQSSGLEREGAQDGNFMDYSCELRRDDEAAPWSCDSSCRNGTQKRQSEKLRQLQKLYNTLQSAQWIDHIQFRKHARVPIINLTHKSGVECDVSLDMSQQVTSLVVRALLQRCGPALSKLSAFLKIYLNQLGLDAPFTGGLGSFKLYVLLAEHIERQPQDIELGPLLMGFLKYYGDSRNLDYFKVISVDGAEDLHFRHVSKLEQICEAFAKAHAVLLKLQLKRKLLKTADGAEGVADGDVGSLPSTSLLAALLNTEVLSVQRMRRRAQCHRYPHHDTTQYSWEDEEAEAGDDVDSFDGDDGDDFVDIADESEEESDGDDDSEPEERSERCDDEEGDNDSTTNGLVLPDYKDLRVPDCSESPSAPNNPGMSSDSSSDAEGNNIEIECAPLDGNNQDGGGQGHDAESESDLESVTSLCDTEDEVNDFMDEIFSPVSESSLYQQLRADLPLLALQECMSPTRRFRMFRPNSKDGKAIIAGTMELPRGVCVKPKQVHMLPRRYAIALGPFRSLCLAECYLRKSYDELMEQEKRQNAAVERIRTLIRANYFDTCSAEDKAFLHQVYITGLLAPSREFQGSLNKFERKLHSESKCCLSTLKLFLTQRAVAVGAPLTDLHSTVRLESLQAKAQRMKEFNPRDEVGKAIAAGLLDLPPTMLVSKINAKKLPPHYQKKLHPFRSLQESEYYKSMSFDELTHERTAVQAERDYFQMYYNSHGWLQLGSTSSKMDKETLKNLVAIGMVVPPFGYVMSNKVKKEHRAALAFQQDLSKYYFSRAKGESIRCQVEQKQRQCWQASVAPRLRATHLPVSSILSALERDIPVLVIQDYISVEDMRLFSPTSDLGRAILKGEQQMPQGMTVLPEQVGALPEIIANTLGPFRMLCVASFYMNKSYEELVQQEERQEAAVRQLKTLYDAGHFVTCPREDLLLLRRVCIAGLLRFENDADFSMSEDEKKLLLRTKSHLSIVSRHLVDRAWCMGLEPRIPPKPLVLSSPSQSIIWPQPSIPVVTLQAPTLQPVVHSQSTVPAHPAWPSVRPPQPPRSHYMPQSTSTWAPPPPPPLSVPSHFTTAPGQWPPLCIQPPSRHPQLLPQFVTAPSWPFHVPAPPPPRQARPAPATALVSRPSQSLTAPIATSVLAAVERDRTLPQWFDPNNLFGQEIITGKFPLPVYMQVAPKMRRFLPKKVRQQLGNFRSLQEKYDCEHVSAEDLRAVNANFQEEVRYIRNCYKNGNWSYFGLTEEAQAAEIDDLIAQAVLDVPKGRPVSAAVLSRHRDSAQLNKELEAYIEQRNKATTPSTNSNNRANRRKALFTKAQTVDVLGNVNIVDPSSYEVVEDIPSTAS